MCATQALLVDSVLIQAVPVNLCHDQKEAVFSNHMNDVMRPIVLV